MSILSNKANYDIDVALNEIELKRLILDVKVETQVTLQLLVEKGIVTREEVATMRDKVKNSENYKFLYEYYEEAEKKAKYYEQNPEQHLKDIFEMKVKGKM